MRFRVEMSATAAEEVRKAHRYLKKHAPEYATRWLLEIREAVLSLQTLPQRCAYAPERELFELEIRQLLQGSYRILFTVEGQTVRVLHVRHAARDRVDPPAG